MATHLIGRTALFGFGMDATVGSGTVPTVGLENLNRAFIKAGQEWAIDQKHHGAPYDHTMEKKPDLILPTYAPEIPLSIPIMGQLCALLCQSVSQSGAGPYVQSISFPSAGRAIDTGAARSVNGQTATIKQSLGQTGTRDVFAISGVVKELKITIGKGRIRVAPSFVFFAYGDAFASGGVYTLPVNDFRGRDAIFKLGDGTPNALYSEEVELTLRANVIPHYYGGVQNGLPYRLVFEKWEGEGRITRPLPAGTNSLLRDNLFDGGDVGNDMLLFLYARTLADYNSPILNNDWRFTLNCSFDDVETQAEDETLESVSFTLRHDGTNPPFLFEQGTTATQAAWAA